MSRSGDLGQTWSGPTRVNQVPEATDPGGDARPKVAIGLGGEVYVSWTKALGKPHTGEVRFSRSLDGGRTFSAPLTVHADRQLIAHRFDALAVNRDGEVFVAWIDKRDLVGGGEGEARGLPRRGGVFRRFERPRRELSRRLQAG